jgi:hypothetical protein
MLEKVVKVSLLVESKPSPSVDWESSEATAQVPNEFVGNSSLLTVGVLGGDIRVETRFV